MSSFKKDASKVMEQLKKAVKIADICMSSAKNLYLIVLLLNKYLFYFSIGVTNVSGSFLTSRSPLRTSTT